MAANTTGIPGNTVYYQISSLPTICPNGPISVSARGTGVSANEGHSLVNLNQLFQELETKANKVRELQRDVELKGALIAQLQEQDKALKKSNAELQFDLNSEKRNKVHLLAILEENKKAQEEKVKELDCKGREVQQLSMLLASEKKQATQARRQTRTQLTQCLNSSNGKQAEYERERDAWRKREAELMQNCSTLQRERDDWSSQFSKSMKSMEDKLLTRDKEAIKQQEDYEKEITAFNDRLAQLNQSHATQQREAEAVTRQSHLAEMANARQQLQEQGEIISKRNDEVAGLSSQLEELKNNQKQQSDAIAEMIRSDASICSIQGYMLLLENVSYRVSYLYERMGFIISEQQQNNSNQEMKSQNENFIMSMQQKVYDIASTLTKDVNKIQKTLYKISAISKTTVTFCAVDNNLEVKTAIQKSTAGPSDYKTNQGRPNVQLTIRDPEEPISIRATVNGAAKEKQQKEDQKERLKHEKKLKAPIPRGSSASHPMDDKFECQSRREINITTRCSWRRAQRPQ